MKKIISLILVLVFVFCTFAGCKPKIENTEEYKMVEMIIEDEEKNDHGSWMYEITDAQYIKDFYMKDSYTTVIKTEDGKYHTTKANELMSLTASYDMYIAVTMTKVKTGYKSTVVFVYLTEKSVEKLREEIKRVG